jgi:DNA-binding XRE family transcriptional regulator
MPTTVYGPTLRKERIAAGVKVTHLAERIGVTRATVHAIEGKAKVPAPRAAQYRAALASFTPDAAA